MKVLRYEITDLCNLKCEMCWSKNWEHKDMPLEGAKRLIDEFERLYPGGKIIFTSREPLASSIFKQILSYTHSKKLEISILTNGILLDNKLRNYIYENDVRMMGFSLHGDEEYHDRIVGVRGAAMRTLNSIESISSQNKKLKSDLSIRITTVMSQNTKKSINYLVEIAKRNSAILRIQHLMWHSETQKNKHKRELYEKYGIVDDCIDGFLSSPTIGYIDVVDTLDSLKKVCEARNVQVEIYPDLSDEQIYRWYSDVETVFEKGVCSHAADSIRVRADGSVVYCQYIEQFYGNINNNNLDDIVKNDKYNNWANNIREGKLLPLCQRCCHVCDISKKKSEYII